MEPIPFLSIIIPTRNRRQRLRECLTSITDLDYPPDRFEVIVVEDGEKPMAADDFSIFKGHFDLTILFQKHAGPAAARNRGTARAKGKYLLFTDDDCRPASNWLTACAKRFSHRPDCALAGKVVNALTDNPYSTATQLVVDYCMAAHNMAPDRAVFGVSSNLALPAALFHAIGGFDETFSAAAGEDRDLCLRWVKNGYPMVYAPEAVVKHFHELSLFTYLKQHYNYGHGAHRFHEKHRGFNKYGENFEQAEFYFNLVFQPLFEKKISGVPSMLLLLFSQIATAMGYMHAGK